MAFLLPPTCASSVVGAIPPSQFHFVNAVSLDGKGRGGWKIAQVVITLGRASPAAPSLVPCNVQVGIPQVNFEEEISDYVAQRAAAAAADQAAQVVLQKTPSDDGRGLLPAPARNGALPQQRHQGSTRYGLPRNWNPEDILSVTGTMGTAFSAEELLSLVHRFYSVGLYDSDSRYKESIEFRRLYSARVASQEHSGPWWTHFLDEVERALPGHDVQDWTYLPQDNCWRCHVYLPGAEDRASKTASVALLSILAPVYVVYTSHVDFDGSKWGSRVSYQPLSETSAQRRVIDPLVASIFDFTRLPPDVLFTPVPDIQCFNVDLGQATLFDCLFTDDRW